MHIPEFGLGNYEKIPVLITSSLEESLKFISKEIAELIKDKAISGEMCVLGLTTGLTLNILYKELIRLHKEEGLSFKNVATFNLEEFYILKNKTILESSHFYVQQSFFKEIDIDSKNIHIPDTKIEKDGVSGFCETYEQKIEEYGGLDLQILNISSNGQIGLNEPGSNLHSKTRLIPLDSLTRMAMKQDFTNTLDIPGFAITMGINTVLKARKIYALSYGSEKASTVQKIVEMQQSSELTASMLQIHNNCLLVLDEQSSSQLTKIKSPWLIGEIEWTPSIIKKAVIDVAIKLGKPILSLTNQDYIENGLSDLLVEKGDAYEINLEVFYMLRDTITGWPAGKPNAFITGHPERSEPYPKRVLIFSPHPDDDIISMGGTFQRLHDQGNDVHVAYQTSGNIAVTDEFVTRFLDFAVGFEEIAGIDTSKSEKILINAYKFLSYKTTEQIDTRLIRSIKGLIRRCEAMATCRYVGINEKNIYFLNLPFYETGTIEKKPMSEKDVKITIDLLRKIKPHQVYCAGDFADPHGTHLVCFNIVLEALKRIKDIGDNWIKECWMWLYKGTWQEWNIEEIEMAVPMSPDQVLRKRFGIFIHQSQKDMIPFQSGISREFWQRAEERNAATAAFYASLGLTHYAAMEAFVRWHY